mmetsp:Transcript_50644/g.162092  ORF Transcript_50644/g.162092 Transcript_50644/m.162092 type:complete len:201 (+) Transcript_50644:557-1159(+)
MGATDTTSSTVRARGASAPPTSAPWWRGWGCRGPRTGPWWTRCLRRRIQTATGAWISPSSSKPSPTAPTGRLSCAQRLPARSLAARGHGGRGGLTCGSARSLQRLQGGSDRLPPPGGAVVARLAAPSPRPAAARKAPGPPPGAADARPPAPSPRPAAARGVLGMLRSELARAGAQGPTDPLPAGRAPAPPRLAWPWWRGH